MVGGGDAPTHFFRRRRQFDGGAPACGGAAWKLHVDELNFSSVQFSSVQFVDMHSLHWALHFKL
jgi:hypothetical protein